jgi:hypothetical protein
MNPENHAYWQARGHNGRSDDWQERTEEEKARDRGERQK